MQFLHCAAHLPIIAIYREPATWQASPICRLKRKLSLTLKRNCAIAAKQFLHCPAHPPLLAKKLCQIPVTPCLAKSHQIAVAMSICLKQFISQKIKALTALMFTVFIYPLTQEFYPHRWRNNFIKMLSWICKKFLFNPLLLLRNIGWCVRGLTDRLLLFQNQEW